MPVRSYGVLKGRVADCRKEVDYDAPHYQVHLRAAGEDFRVAVNVRSAARHAPDLLFRVDEDFRHPLLARLPALPEGFTPLGRGAGVPEDEVRALALDYVRGGVVERGRMRALPHDRPGADNDLNEMLEKHLALAVGRDDVHLYAYGSPWRQRGRDAVFGFRPARGLHEVHMNQGNPRPHRRRGPDHSRDNGTWQDGGLLLHERPANRWVALFLAFQSQSWRTDEHGHPLDGRPAPPHRARRGERAPRPAGAVRIVAAMVNPHGEDPGGETVTLLNTTPHPVALDGWTLSNRRQRHRLWGELAPGAPRVVRLPPMFPLSNRGGALALYDGDGARVDAVAYTREQARWGGREVTF